MKLQNIRATETVAEYQARITQAILEKVAEINALADACLLLKTTDATRFSGAMDHLSDKLSDAKAEAQNLIDDLG